MIAIRVENLTKVFRLGSGRAAGYSTLREALVEAAGKAFRQKRLDRSHTGVVRALDDVSFTVKAGEVMGVIGRNGSGKSTLLKILSRVTDPTAGRVEFQGRVGSLLEVGTGFHPELTGRENVYLNGAILGMGRREITTKFDAIVTFSEIERFLDTPVKRYSSGMYVRLAFAVAAFLEPEILIVDEVLAVGDATFQRKCVRRMSELAETGRTILFVSHNMDIVPRLCRTALLLDRGRPVARGPAADVVREYLDSSGDAPASTDLTQVQRSGNGLARFTNLANSSGCGAHRSGADLRLRMEIESQIPLADVSLAVNLRTLGGTKLYSAWTREQRVRLDLTPGRQVIECVFQGIRPRPGMTLEVELWLAGSMTLDSVPHAMRIPIVDGDDTGLYTNAADQGCVLTPVSWRTNGSSELKLAAVSPEAGQC